MPLSFEWDERKAESNFAKHGVSFEESSTFFGDPLSLTISDPAHSQVEDRSILLGHSKSGARESQSLVTSAATPTIWDLLRENPDRYIYPAVRHGTDKANPPASWTAPAERSGDGALGERGAPGSASAIESGVALRLPPHSKITDINDFITLNLDLRQFAQDVIQNCEGPDLLMAFWQGITTITVLDLNGVGFDVIIGNPPYVDRIGRHQVPNKCSMTI